MKTISLLSLTILLASVAWGQTPPVSQPGDPAAAVDTGAATANPGTIQGCLSGSGGNFTLTQASTGTAFKLSGNEEELNKRVGQEVQITGQMLAVGAAQDQTAASASPDGNQMNMNGIQFQVSDVKMVADKFAGNATATASSSSTDMQASSDLTPAASWNASATTTAVNTGDTNSGVGTTPATTAGGSTKANSYARESGSATAAMPQSDNIGKSTMNSAASAQETSPVSTPANDSVAATRPAGTQTTTGNLHRADTNVAKINHTGLPHTATDLPLVGLLGVGFLTAGLMTTRCRTRQV